MEAHPNTQVHTLRRRAPCCKRFPEEDALQQWGAATGWFGICFMLVAGTELQEPVFIIDTHHPSQEREPNIGKTCPGRWQNWLIHDGSTARVGSADRAFCSEASSLSCFLLPGVYKTRPSWKRRGRVQLLLSQQFSRCRCNIIVRYSNNLLHPGLEIHF